MPDGDGQYARRNATNVSRDMRARGIDLVAQYGARVRIVYVEAPAARLYEQNRDRAHPVPEAILERLLDRWEVPDLTEAHAVHVVLDGQPGYSPGHGR